MRDELRERLARLDPMHPGVPTESVTTSSSRELLEEIMSTPTGQVTTDPAPKKRSRWLMGVAAAAVLVVAVGGVIALTGDSEEDQVATGPPLELNAPADDPMAMCIMFSVEELAKAPLAFEGTVTSVEGETVTLDVDEWFKGGDAEQVVLHAPAGMEALIGGIPFEEGGQYLVTAYEGTVNYCGFSGPSTPEFRAAFEEAFAG
jgi:hypothetical protein